METAKERALAWVREDNERRARAQSELERDEQELAELEIFKTLGEDTFWAPAQVHKERLRVLVPSTVFFFLRCSASLLCLWCGGRNIQTSGMRTQVKEAVSWKRR